MCGIFGLIDPDAPPLPTVRRLNDLMQQRGPDGAGTYAEGPLAMAMRRLAIIDLTSGDQPLYARDGRVVTFQNGEIYNYQPLRRELEAAGCVFRTKGDTEVLAHGYAVWGIEGLLRRLDGMFALAIFDRDTRVLHLARDRFGEKPLFISGDGRHFAYGSSLLGLVSLPWVALDLNRRALDQYLALQYVPGPSTLFRAIERVLPGERVEIPVDRPIAVRHRFHRPELRDPKLHGKYVPVRYDPWDASTVYVQINKRWFAAQCKALVGHGQMTEKERELIADELCGRLPLADDEEPSPQRLKEFLRIFTPAGAAKLAFERQQENRELQDEILRLPVELEAVSKSRAFLIMKAAPILAIRKPLSTLLIVGAMGALANLWDFSNIARSIYLVVGSIVLLVSAIQFLARNDER